MGIGLDPTVTPDLAAEKGGKPLPVESVKGTDKTAYLNIDLKIDKAYNVLPMTAVFAPDPSQLSGVVDVLLWLHGDKHYWDNTGRDDWFPGKSIRYYLTTYPLTRLREFILKSGKRKFLLVAPTLSNGTGGLVSDDDRYPGPLAWDRADAEAYLQQAVNGAKKHLGANVTGVGNIVLAAHSGGGHIQARMADSFGGKFDKMNELWCFDSTFWDSGPLIRWVLKGHANPRLWVYSFDHRTARGARKVLKFTEPLPPEESPPARRVWAKVKAAAHDALHAVHAAAHAVVVRTTPIEVLIDHGRTPPATDFFQTTYGGRAGGHYESIGKYLTTLVDTSRNLT